MGGYGRTPLEQHFDRELVVIWAGPEAVDVLFSGTDVVDWAAVHEAGHVVAAWRFGRGIAGAIVRSEGSGVALLGPIGDSTASASTQSLWLEEPATPTAPASRREPARTDVRRAVAIARLLRQDKTAAWALVRTRRFEARIFVNQHADLIRAVASELRQRGRISGLEAEQIIERTLADARVKRWRELGFLKAPAAAGVMS